MERNCLNCKRGRGYEDKVDGITNYFCEIDEEIECIVKNPSNYICKRYKPKKTKK